LAAAPLFAQDEVRPASVLLLPMEVRGAGARAGAMGSAFAAVEGGPECLLFNPAGLASLEGFEVQAHHYEGFTSLREERLIGAFETGWLGVAACEVHSVGYGRVDSRDEQGYPFDGATTGRQGAAAGWGVPWGNGHSIGAAAHVAREQLMGRGVSAAWADAGLQVRVHPRLRLGAACRGAGPPQDTGRLPLLLSSGAAFRTGGDLPLLLALSVDLQPRGAHVLAVGAEQTVSGNFVARLGSRVPLSQERVEGFRAFAAGFGYRRGALRLDYSLEPQGDLGFTHRVSLGAASSPGGSGPAETQPSSPTPTRTVTPTHTATATPTPTATGTPTIPSSEAAAGTPALSSSPVAKGPAAAASPASPSQGQDQLRVYEMGATKGMDSAAKARVKELLEAVRRPGAGPEAWWELGQFYELSGYPTYARQCYENVLKLDPGHAGALRKLGK
jgi:hypothetical protein